MDVDRDKLIDSLYNLGYERVTIVNGTGQLGVRGYVIDIFPTSYENAIRIEFWGDTIDSIKYFNIDTQLSMNEIDEVNIYPFTEFILDKYDENIIKKQKYLPNYSENVGNISSYLSDGVICYYDYNTLLTSYSLLIDSIEAYDKENKPEIKTNYMSTLADIKGIFNIYYY